MLSVIQILRVIIVSTTAGFFVAIGWGLGNLLLKKYVKYHNARSTD